LNKQDLSLKDRIQSESLRVLHYEIEIAKIWDRMSKKMHVWAGGPGVATFGCIPSLSDTGIFFLK